ncbi:unnamed protein product, partial [Brassica oleracea]
MFFLPNTGTHTPLALLLLEKKIAHKGMPEIPAAVQCPPLANGGLYYRRAYSEVQFCLPEDLDLKHSEGSTSLDPMMTSSAHTWTLRNSNPDLT